MNPYCLINYKKFVFQDNKESITIVRDKEGHFSHFISCIHLLNKEY